MSKKLSSFAEAITVEPAYFLYNIVHVIIDITNTNLYLQKKCRFNKTSEPDLNIPCDDEKLGILFSSEMNSFYRFIMLTFLACYAIFATSWSDAVGRRRRPLIFLPIIGIIIKAKFGCLHSYFWYWNPITAMLSNNLVEMVTGGIAFIVFGAQLYVCDASSIESRTMRVGILTATKTLADLVGNGGSGFLLRCVGFYYTYLVCLVLSVISLIMAVGLIKDTSVPVKQISGSTGSINAAIITDAFNTVFRKSMGKKRIVVLILLIIHTMMYFSTNGEKGILYLFLRYKFHWEEREYSAYVFYRSLGVILGGIFCSVMLSKVFQVHDGLIGSLAAACDTMTVLGFVFAQKNWHLYVAPLFDVFHGAALSVSFSFLSKFYDNAELGRLSSVISVCMLISPLCFPIYNGIFNATLDIFPSAYFLLSVMLDTIIIVLYYVAYLLSRKLEFRAEVPDSTVEAEKNPEILSISNGSCESRQKE